MNNLIIIVISVFWWSGIIRILCVYTIGFVVLFYGIITVHTAQSNSALIKICGGPHYT